MVRRPEWNIPEIIEKIESQSLNTNCSNQLTASSRVDFRTVDSSKVLSTRTRARLCARVCVQDCGQLRAAEALRPAQYLT